MTWKPIGDLASECVNSAIERLRAMPEYAGRPAWDAVVAEEMIKALKTIEPHPVTVEMLERWRQEALRYCSDQMLKEVNAAIAQMKEPTIAIKFEAEELRLLSDNFTQSFAPGDEGNEDLDAISVKLTDAYLKLRKKT